MNDPDPQLPAFKKLKAECATLRKTEEQLREALRQAEEKSKSKSRFLATMSHEIRTPMHGILTASGLLQNMDLLPEPRELAQMIYHSTRSLLGILNDILDFSRVESGKLRLDRISFNLQKVVMDVYDLLSEVAAAKGIELLVDYPDGHGAFLVGDPLRVRQILINLTGNAVKFTRNGYVLVRVRLVPLEAQSMEVLLEVEDSGPGIPEGGEELLFHEFEQGDPATSGSYAGSGLGLAISRALAEAMGGKLTGCNRPGGEGALFTFRWLCPSTGERFLQNTRQLHPLQGAADRRVLVVEDNPINRRLAEKVLEKLGVQSMACVNGIEALERLKEFPFDLVLMDIQMPELDGLETTRAIRRSGGSYAAIPVIAMTANVMDEDRRHCMEAGMNGFLPKPIQFDQVMEELERWFQMTEGTVPQREG